MRWLMLLAVVALGCGSASGGDDDGDGGVETSVLPGTACEFGLGPVADDSLVRLDVTFPGTLTASEVIATVSWVGGDLNCQPFVPLWSAGVDLTADATASSANGVVYARQSAEDPITAPVVVGVAIRCPEVPFSKAQIRLDKAHDGQGKLMADCVGATV